MICLKGCSKEIVMLNELLSKAIQSKNDALNVRQVGIDALTDSLREHRGIIETKDSKIEELTQANLRSATAFKNCKTDKLRLEEELKDKTEALQQYMEAGARRIKELESAILNYREKVAPALEREKEVDRIITNNLSDVEFLALPSMTKEQNAIFAPDFSKHPLAGVNDEMFGTCYNEPVSGEPLFSPDFVGEVKSPKYPAKKKK